MTNDIAKIIYASSLLSFPKLNKLKA